MNPLHLSLKLTFGSQEALCLVRTTDAIRLMRDGDYEALPWRRTEGLLGALDRRQMTALRSFVARARLTGFALSVLDDHALVDLVRKACKANDLSLLRACEGRSGSRDGSPTELRGLVRAIEGKSRRRLAHAGRLYKLVADVDLQTVPNRDSFEVVSRNDAGRVLDALAGEPAAGIELRSALLKARDKLTADWRPPLAPDGLVLLRKVVVQAAVDREPPLSPSQMAKLLKKKDWIEIEVVYDDDKPYTGPYRLTRPDGGKDEGKLAGGFFGAYDIDAGTFKIEMPVRTGTVPDEELALDDEEEAKTARRVRLTGMLFDANKCFLLPQALPGIKTIIAMHDEEPDAEVLIVGHAGSDEDLKGADIAFDRAQILGAYLKSKPNVWLNWFGPDKKARSRWGTREVQLMLSVLPEGGTPLYQGHASGVTDDRTTAALKAFQELTNAEKSAGLPTDGKADFATRKALVEAYMGIADTTLDDDVLPVAHGCEGHFEDTATTSGIASDDRRLEVFFFKEKIDPRPTERVSPAGSTQYPAWLGMLVETKDFECHGIHVQIVDAKKQPAPFATVHLTGPTTADATTDEHGFVSFFGLRQGEYTISSEKNGYKIGVSKLTYPTAKTVPGFAKKVA
jgi:hypothetical protein